MPFGIRPSNVRVCHSTTRASRGSKLSADGNGWQVSFLFLLLLLLEIPRKTEQANEIPTIRD